LREALNDLTPEQQNVLALRFGFGLPIKDVAETVNKSEGSVKMLQARAIAALTRRLTGQGAGEA
jgi:RNA polymerase sigma-70 factor (ECF subfamily)